MRKKRMKAVVAIACGRHSLRSRCGQCGKQFRAQPCGFSHALIAAKSPRKRAKKRGRAGR